MAVTRGRGDDPDDGMTAMTAPNFSAASRLKSAVKGG